MCNSNHHSSEKYIYVYISTIYCTMLYYFKTKYQKKKKKKNIRGIRIKSVVYLDFEMQQKVSDHSSSWKRNCSYWS